MSLMNDPQVLSKCREYEQKFPMVPDTWKRYKQYATPDDLRSSIKQMWGFGVSKEIRFEEGIRKDNSDVKIYTWDPTPISVDTIKVANAKGANVTHTLKAYDPSEQSMMFYTTDHKKRCWSLENHDPVNLIDSIEVQTTSLSSIVKELGKEVDIIKLDIEGRWFEMCSEILDLDLPVKMVLVEFEMYFGPIEQEFGKLDQIINGFKNKGYRVYTNRILAGSNIEISFLKNE
jgi:FkbM family methyltransferase